MIKHYFSTHIFLIIALILGVVCNLCWAGNGLSNTRDTSKEMPFAELYPLLAQHPLFHTTQISEIESHVKALMENNNPYQDYVFHAVQIGHLDIVSAFLYNKADFDMINAKGESLVLCAIKNGHLHLVKYLIEYETIFKPNAEIDPKLLYWAAKEGQFDTVKYLISKGVDLETSPESCCDWNNTPLFIAVNKCHLEIVEYLISRGANTHLYDDEYNTPLHNIAFATLWVKPKVCLKIATCLINNGAHVNARNKRHQTPLHQAIYNLDLVRYLIEQGAHPNMYDTKDETPLHKAADWGELKVVHYLLKNGANPNTVNIYGETPLSAAQIRGYTWISWLLKIYGAKS